MTRQPPSDPFEEEIRHALADEARQPAPDRLVARVAAMPVQGRPRRSPMTRLRDRLGAGSGAGAPGPRLALGGGLVVLVVAVLGMAAIVGRPAVGPGASPTPSPAASSEASPPAGSPSASSAAPTPGPTGLPVAAGFEPASVTFVSADDGWALGGAPCTGGTCAAIARPATEGGPGPGPEPRQRPPASTRPAEAAWPGSASPAERTAGRSARNSGRPTTAGRAGAGRHPRLPAGSQVMALEAAGGFVHAAVFDGDGAVVRIASSPVGEDAWTVSSTTVDVGGGPVPAAQIVLHGTSGWLVEVNRAVVGGARLVDGTWQAWRPPCLDANGPATLAAATDRDLAAACDVGLWSTPSGVHLFTSADGGASFAEAAAPVPVSTMAGIATPSAGTVVVGGGTPGWRLGARRLVRRRRHVERRPPPAGCRLTVGDRLHDRRPGRGHRLLRGSSQLFMTRDGGRTWLPPSPEARPSAASAAATGPPSGAGRLLRRPALGDQVRDEGRPARLGVRPEALPVSAS